MKKNFGPTPVIIKRTVQVKNINLDMQVDTCLHMKSRICKFMSANI